MHEDEVFKALADPTRRLLLDALFAREGRTLGELEAVVTGHVEMTRFGVSKHLRQLEAAGLVLTRKRGREKLHYLNPVPIQLIHDRWIGKYTRRHTRALVDLKHHLEETAMTTNDEQTPAAAEHDDEPRVHMFAIYIDAPAAKIWEAITSSEFTTRFGYGGEVEVDLTPGGSIRDLTTPQMKEMGMGDVAASGTVIEVDPPHRLVQTWSAAWHDEPDTTLTYEITEYPGGAACLTLTHDCSAAPNTAKDVRGGGDATAGGGGWPWILSSLKTLLETERTMTGAGA